MLHRNVVSCGFADIVHLVICDSVSAAALFSDESLQWAWRPKVSGGGWLSGDDFDEGQWPRVVGAVKDGLPGAQPWSTNQWRWLKP
jgi:hypothetical protein